MLKKFTDPEFPPKLETYCSNDQIKKMFEGYQFCRAQRIPDFVDEDGDVMLDLTKVSPSDI